eukprot:151452-Amphidinium_carterae.1
MASQLLKKSSQIVRTLARPCWATTKSRWRFLARRSRIPHIASWLLSCQAYQAAWLVVSVKRFCPPELIRGPPNPQRNRKRGAGPFAAICSEEGLKLF